MAGSMKSIRERDDRDAGRGRAMHVGLIRGQMGRGSASKELGMTGGPRGAGSAKMTFSSFAKPSSIQSKPSMNRRELSNELMIVL